MLAVPVLRDDRAIGVLAMWRTRSELFTDSHVRLLQSFADQAAIAMENSRLIGELEERNREVSEALNTQTAMAEVLEIIGRSTRDETASARGDCTAGSRRCCARNGGCSGRSEVLRPS